MNNLNNALNVLKAKIRQSKKQYRHGDDVSHSLFHPAKGFVDGCSLADIEVAIEEFEMELKTEYLPKEKVEHPGITVVFNFDTLSGLNRFQRMSNLY